jgi:hypothetical protein
MTNKEEHYCTKGEYETVGDDESGNSRRAPGDRSVHVAPYHGVGHALIFSDGSV